MDSANKPTSGNVFDAQLIHKYFKNQKLPTDHAKPFIDDLFPPNENSLLALDENNKPIDIEAYNKNLDEIDVNNIYWKRASEIFPEFLLFESKIEFNDVKQGNLGNCYFLSSLAALTEFPNLIYKIFKTKRVSENGLYEIALFIDGEWQIVIVDDYIPINKRLGECAFAKPNVNEIWVIILEKAWAKVNGGYLNTIGGYSSEPLSALTGFAKRRIDTDYFDLDALWKIIAEADENDHIMCCATRNDAACAQKNLVALHAYTLIKAKSTNFNGKKIRLCQIRNPHGSKEWNGDWSDRSPLWNNKLDKIFDHKVNDDKDLDDGLFFICIEDFKKYFKTIYICPTIYDSEVKSFKISENEIAKPQVFSLSLPKDSDATISASTPFWRFNRNLKNKNHPISIIIAKVGVKDGIVNGLQFLDGEFSADDDPAINKKLTKGFYLIWVYSYTDEYKNRNIDHFNVRISANSRFTCKLEKNDSNFELIREIMLTGIRNEFKEQIAKDEKFGTLKNSLGQTGIGYYVKFNNGKSFMKLTIDVSQMLGFNMLPPYDKEKNYELYLYPGCEFAIFGIKNIQYGKFCFNLDMDIWSSSGKFEEDHNEEKKSPYLKKTKEQINALLAKFFDYNYLINNQNPKNNYYDYISPSREEAKYSMDFESIDVNEITKEQLIHEYPSHMEKVLKFPAVKKEKLLTWKKVEFTNGVYIGQINDDNKRHGRGAYIFSDGSYMVGIYENSERSGAFEEYDSNGKLTFKGKYLKGKKNGKGLYYYDNGSYYDGEFKNDVKHGKGSYCFPSGQKYEGDWVDNKKEGKGIYYFSKDEYWEGTFLNNEFHGCGNYKFSSGTVQKITFKNGVQVS